LQFTERISFHNDFIETIQIGIDGITVKLQDRDKKRYGLWFRGGCHIKSSKCTDAYVGKISILQLYEGIQAHVAYTDIAELIGELPDDVSLRLKDGSHKLYTFYEAETDKAILAIVAKGVECETEETQSYTYFSIRGEFDPDDITERLGIEPIRKRKKGDEMPRPVGVTNVRYYNCSGWCAEESNVDRYDVEKQCLDTIKNLKKKIPELLEIKSLYNVDFTIFVVPTIYNGETPMIGFNKEVIEFCHLTGTYIDVDMYVY